MRHAARKNLRNGAIVLGALCCLLAAPLTYVLVHRDATVVTVVEHESCSVPPVDTDGVLERLGVVKKRPHRARPSLTCGPEVISSAGERHEVPEPGTWALIVVGVGAMLLAKAA